MKELIQTTHDTFLLPSLGLLKVSGTGAFKLLQGQVTCDVANITSTHGTMAALCNPQGRIISLFYLTKMDEDYILVMPATMVAITQQALAKYAPFYKATLEDATTHLAILGCLNVAPLSEAKASIALPQSMRSLQLINPPQDPSLHGDELTWQQLDILAGIPSLSPAISCEFLPHDLNLIQLGAVSFTKGCFTGQEIIARMEYRGKPKKHLFQGVSASLLLPGAEFPPAGTVINCCEKVYNETYLVLFCANEK